MADKDPQGEYDKNKGVKLRKARFTSAGSNATPEDIKKVTGEFENSLKGREERKKGEDYSDFSSIETKAQMEEAERKFPGIQEGESLVAFEKRRQEAREKAQKVLREPGTSSFAKGGSDSGEQDPGSTTTKQ